MCELYGLTARRPLPASKSLLSVFRQRGGGTADNPDGWGVAWRVEGRFRLEKAPEIAVESAQFEQLAGCLASDLMIAHVRKAKYPPVNTLNNTHPFLRYCCERHWAFAHNGLVPEVVEMERRNQTRVCRPEGETDSEFAFCHLLSHVKQHALIGGYGIDWLCVLNEISERIATRGQFNFLLSDGEYLIAYGHDRLHYLEAGDHVLIASAPLSGALGWTAFRPGELRIYKQGAYVEALACMV